MFNWQIITTVSDTVYTHFDLNESLDQFALRYRQLPGGDLGLS